MSGLTLNASGGNTLVSLGNGQKLLIIGVTSSALSASNFIFNEPDNTAPVANDDANTMGEDDVTADARTKRWSTGCPWPCGATASAARWAGNAVDMAPRHAGRGLNNAAASPTCPQRQQPQPPQLICVA